MDESLIEKNINLVHLFVNKLNYCYVDREDLFQAGLMGLYEAAKRYDKTKNIKFSTFASYYIIGEIKKELRENKLVKLSKKIYSLKRKIGEMSNVNELDQIATEIGINKEIVCDILVCEGNDVVNFDNELISKIKEDKNKSIFSYAKECLKGVFFDVIKLKYIENYSQKEIGDRLNMSQSKVSRIEKVSLKRLKKYYLQYNNSS